jgi:hypothetical protein
MKRNKLPLNLQFFAEGDAGAGGEGTNQQQGEQQTQTPQFDYEKLAGIIAGKQSVTEETVLKNYFKQQGLSEDDMKQAISSFKQQKAANQPDVNALQTQVSQAQMQAQQAVIERDAYLLSGELGIGLKTMPYLLKMADLSAVVVDGKVSQDKLKEALNKVLEEVPQLKPQAEATQNGFRQIGVGNQTQTATKKSEPTAVPTKRWNRWN